MQQFVYAVSTKPHIYNKRTIFRSSQSFSTGDVYKRQGLYSVIVNFTVCAAFQLDGIRDTGVCLQFCCLRRGQIFVEHVLHLFQLVFIRLSRAKDEKCQTADQGNGEDDGQQSKHIALSLIHI